MLRQFANKFYHLWSLISTGRPRALVPGATDIVGGRRCDNSGLETFTWEAAASAGPRQTVPLI